MAMGPRINAHLALLDGGTRVAVRGPTGTWEPYAVSATFAVVIGQVKSNGDVVLAVGRSTDTYEPGGEKWWDADAVVFDPQGGQFQPGIAAGWAIASVLLKDGNYQQYPWSVVTELIASPPLPE
jgi:hypothetical protein